MHTACYKDLASTAPRFFTPPKDKAQAHCPIRWLKLPQPECRQTSPEIARSSRLIVSGSSCVFQTLLFSEDDLTAGALKYKPILWVESWPGHLCVQVHPRLHTGNLGRS